ncbi:hypothetical protein CN151_27605 [Sinorhizobium meliloti]|nr:hypothetical protein CN151_27605 [Sinorhizobium meliloti]RVM93261.1 hypothetical protein CN119_15135 [Sinorhizobium meliloti]RVN12620.1 hypothetical protein CN112_06840 [Sinorhizobium meliloti]
MRLSSAETTSAPDSILVQSAAVGAQVQEVVDAVSQLPRERHLYLRGASIWPPLPAVVSQRFHSVAAN